MAIVFVSKMGKVIKCSSNVSGLLLGKQEIEIDRCYIPVFYCRLAHQNTITFYAAFDIMNSVGTV